MGTQNAAGTMSRWLSQWYHLAGGAETRELRGVVPLGDLSPSGRPSLKTAGERSDSGGLQVVPTPFQSPGSSAPEATPP